MKKINLVGALLALLVGGLALTGCTTPKDVAYFQDLDTAVITESAQRRAIRVQPEDKLSIIVNSKDPALAALFNLPVLTNRIGQNNSYSGTGAQIRNYQTSQSEGIASYTVDPQGDIDFPVLGKIHIAGMTRSEVAGFIKGELMGRDLVKDPTVTVEFLNTVSASWEKCSLRAAMT